MSGVGHADKAVTSVWAGEMLPMGPTRRRLLNQSSRSRVTHSAQSRAAQGIGRFVTCTAIGAAARSTVEALTFRAVTRTLLVLHTWQS